jgi:hypothetical protein|tara:strand:+ start:2567 stop:3079 length:513 start_codon:yes stop_codon:yes gene_type:complete
VYDETNSSGHPFSGGRATRCATSFNAKPKDCLFTDFVGDDEKLNWIQKYHGKTKDNDAHTPTSPRCLPTRRSLLKLARERKREKRERDANAGEAITDLPNHLVVEHILKSEYFDDPADLARLPAVSRGMRDAVTATGLRFEELDEKRAVDLGCLSAVQRLQRGGRLSRQE